MVWLGPDGNLYGTTVESGNANDELFKITTKGALSDLYDFTEVNNGTHPYGELITETDGRLYGVASASCGDLVMPTIAAHSDQFAPAFYWHRRSIQRIH